MGGNDEELGPDSPFTSESITGAMKEIKQLYAGEDVELTNKLLVQELKRGLHVKLFDLMRSLEYTIEHESNVASITPNGFMPMGEVLGEMEKVMEPVMENETQVFRLITSIETLDYRTIGD